MLTWLEGNLIEVFWVWNRRRRRRLENTSQRAYPIRHRVRGGRAVWGRDGWIYSTLPSARTPKKLGRILGGGSRGRQCCHWTCRKASPNWRSRNTTIRELSLFPPYGPLSVRGRRRGRVEWAAGRGRSEVKHRTSDVMGLAFV